MVEKLEGLSAEDRQLWEQKYQDRLAGRAPEEIERLWRDSRFVKKYKNNPGYKWLSTLPEEERDRIYNKDYIKETNFANALTTPMTVDMGGKAVLNNQKVSPRNFSIEMPAVESPNRDTKKLAQETLDVLNFTKDPATQKAIDDYQTVEQQYVKANPEYLSSEWYKKLAIKLADEKSPVYKKYKNYEWFNLSDEQWGNALKKYEVDKTIYGEEDANERFNNDIMKIASEQEPYYRKGALAFLGMGAYVVGGLSVVGGMTLATPEAIYDAAKNVIVDDQGIRFDQAFINTLVSHPAVAYGTKITLYGTLNTDRMKYIDEELGGLADTGFAKDPEGGIFTENLPFELLQQHGFTALSMGLSVGASAALNGVVKGVAKASANKLSKKLAGDLLKKKLAESAIKYNTLNSALLATTVPLFAASVESGMNGYQVKEEIFNELNLKNIEAYMAKVNSDVAEQELRLNLNRGAAEGQSFVSESEKQIMQENAKRKYLPEYLQGEAHAEALAMQGMASLFYTTTFVNGAANATLLRGLQAPRVQSALNNSKLFSKVSKFMKPRTTASGTIGSATVKTVTPTWLKVGAIVKQPAGEYAEEYIPAAEGIATAEAKNYNMTLFLDKSYNSDIELEVGQAMEGQYGAFMEGVGKALVSKEAHTEGVYGALSSVIGGPMIRKGDYTTSTVDRDGKMTSKFSLARREGEGKLAHASRLMPWQSGVAMEVRSQINLAKAAKKEAELLLLNLNDPELAARLKHAKTSMAWGKDMGDAAEAGDEFAYRNSEQGRAIQDAILLNKIKDTDLGKAHVSTMKRLSQMEMNSPDAIQYIKEVKANPDNLSDGMTDELIVEQGKKNATRYLENLEFVSKETDLLNKQLGNVSDDVLSTLIYGRSQLQNWEKRAESLGKEITAVNILSPTASSPVNVDQTSVLKLFGSHKNMVAKKLALEKGIKARELSLKDYIKTHKKLTKPQLQAIDRYRLEIKSKKEELKAINALEKTVEGESLMNEHDILRAPADLRAHMLNPDNKNSFTAAQLKVIEKVTEQGLAHSPEFLTKVQDAGKISEALGLYYSQYTKFLNNPGYLISYAERARLNKENAVFESNAQKIAKIDNYEMFSSELDDIFNNPKNSKAVITKSTLDKLSKDDPNHFYHKYKKDRTDFMGVLNSAIRSGNNEEMSEDDVAMVANAVKFLQANNVDLKDSSKMVEVMTAVDANGVNIFQDFMENQPKTSLLATKEGTYTSPEDVITKLKFVLDKYNKELEDLKSKDPKIVATETPASANITPVVPVVDVPKAPNNVTPGSNTELDDTPVGDDPQTPAEVSAAEKETLRSGIKTVEQTVKAAPKAYSKKVKERIIKDFSKITERLQDSPDATLETLMSEISKLQADYTLLAANTSGTDENTMYNHAGMLAQTIFTNLQALNSKQQNSIFDKLYFDYESVERAQSPDAASIEVLNIAYLKRRFSNVGSPLITYLNVYKVEEFLARNFKKFAPKEKTKIKFMYDPKLAKDIQSSMEAAGNKEYDLNAVPIVAVTLVSKKTPTSIEMEEDGQTVYYQPIGILPSTTNPYAQGANRTKYLRDQLPAKFADLTTPTLLVDAKGNTIATTFASKINTKSPEKTNDRNIADVIVGQLNNTPENEALKALNKTERLKSPLYKSIRDAFIKRFVSVKTNTPTTSTTRLAFTQSNLNFGDENDVKYLYVIVNNGGDITKIEERNSDTKLVDLFLQENVNKEVAINSNSRVEKFAFKLKLFIQNDFSKHTISVTVNSETGEVSATDSSAEIKKLEESLTNSLNHVIFAKGSWTYTITPTDLVDANNNRLFNLSLTNQEGKDISIPLGQISKSELSIDSQFEILQNIFKAANSQQVDFKFQVNYSDADIANSKTANPKQQKMAFKNMQDMFDDGLIYINQTSTEFQITGFTMHSPYAKDGEILKTNEVVTTPTVTDKTITSPNGEKVDSETMVADAKTTSTETKDAEVNNLLLEQQKHSILFKLSDDGKYYINTKTGELFINLDYNEQDVNKQDIQKPEGTINVYWLQPESETSTKMLSNLAPRKFTYEGREYGSVEHAYQSNKSGTFDKVTYDAYNSLKEIPNQQGKGWGRKIAPKVSIAEMKAADSLGLMKKLVVESFKQNSNSEAAKKLLQYENFTHNTNELIDKAFLEGLKLAQTELLNSKQVQSVKIVETTNIISLENSRIAALYDKINNLIKIDRQLLRQKYQERAWTNPRKLIEILDGKQIESYAQPLSADLFKSYEEWELFVINHEYQHSLYSRQDFNKDFPNKTKGDYESEINRRALLQLNYLNDLNKELAQKIQDKLQNLYPEIKLNITNNPIWEQGDNIFNQEEYNNQVNYRLKTTEKVLDNITKIKQWEKNKSISEDVLWNKIQGLGIPKEQLELIKNSEGNTVEEKLLDFANQYSFAVEINTAKGQVKTGTKEVQGSPTKYYSKSENRYYRNTEELGWISSDENNKNQEVDVKTPEDLEPIEFDTYITDTFSELDTQHYSDLSAPGNNGNKYQNDPDWEYQELEISTPLITPSIKGHAKFATDNGIGWARVWYNKKTGVIEIQEVQSDLFQKGRDSKYLTGTVSTGPIQVTSEPFLQKIKKEVQRLEEESELPFVDTSKVIVEGREYERLQDGKWYRRVKDEYTGDINKNQFLQLLNKDNNWVKFFVKSIIQDSAKKGYKKVLFPSGETAAKIEGHETLANEINSINKTIESLQKDIEKAKVDTRFSKEELNSIIVRKQNTINELEQRKSELKSQGIEKLKPIEAFYEIQVGNILEKLFGKDNVKTIIDEYGNQWREITINQARDLAEVLLQRNEANQIIGQANIKALSVLIDAANQKQDTLPHEYAHHYIAWYRNTPIVQEAIKKWGSEEALVQSIGEQVVKLNGEAYSWWNKFAKWIMNQFNSLSKLQKEELTQILTDAFLTRQDLSQQSNILQKQNVTSEKTKIDNKNLSLSLQMLGLNNLKKNFKISGQVLEGKNSFKVVSKADFIATTPDGKIVVILDATKHADNIEEKLNMQKELLEQNAKFKVATLYKADVNGKLTEVSILNSKEMAELSKNKIKQLTKSELINIEEEKSPSVVTKPATVEDNLLLKTKEANTNNSTETLQDMVAGLDMFADLGIAEDLTNTPTSSISEFDWNNLKNLVLESGETMNDAEVKKMLESTGITELIWNNMTEQMRKNTLRCKGFL